MNIKNSNSLLNLSTAKFDLISKAVKGFACKEIRIENSTLILENTGKSVAYVQLDEFLDGKTDVNFCVNMPKDRLDVVRAAKTNSDVSIVEIDPFQVSIHFGNFTAVLGKNVRQSRNISDFLTYSVETESCNLQLYRNLINSICKPSGTYFYVHAQANKVVSLGTGADSLDLDPDNLAWVERRDIVVNCNLNLRSVFSHLELSIVRVAGKLHLLIEYTLTDNFVVKHFFKAN